MHQMFIEFLLVDLLLNHRMPFDVIRLNVEAEVKIFKLNKST